MEINQERREKSRKISTEKERRFIRPITWFLMTIAVAGWIARSVKNQTSSISSLCLNFSVFTVCVASGSLTVVVLL